MKLRSLSLTNVRKFGGRTASLRDIGDGVTVISEANEFGKSTFFDALHALFFAKYSSMGKDVKSLQPHSGGAVKISAEIEIPSGRFVIEKSFLAQKRASVSKAGGALVAQDDEAESWIAALMDNGLEGPAGLLWVKQGTTGLEPAGTVGAEKERLLGARRDLLSSVAGEIDKVTGGRRMDRVLARCQEELSKLAIASGKAKKNGPWGQIQAEIAELETREVELSALKKDLSENLAGRKSCEAELSRMNEPEAWKKRKDALTAAELRFKEAESHAEKSRQAAKDLDLKTLQSEAAQTRLNNLLQAAAKLEQVRQEDTGLQSELQAARQTLAEAGTQEQQAAARLEQAQAAVKSFREQEKAAQQAAQSRQARDQVKQLSERLEKAETQQRALEDAKAQLDGITITPVLMQAVTDAQNRLHQAKARAEAQSVTVTLHYDGAARVSLDGKDVNAGEAVAISSRQSFDLPGIGALVVDPGQREDGDRAAEDFKQALSGFEAALRKANVSSVEEAHAALAALQEAAQRKELAEGVIASLVPEGLDTLRGLLAKARVEADAVPAGEVSVQDPVALAAALETGEADEREARAVYERCREVLSRAREAEGVLREKCNRAAAALAEAKAAYGEADSFEDRKATAARQASIAETAVKDASASLLALQENAPDLETAAADLKRAKTVVEQADKRIGQLKEQLVGYNARIQARAEDGVEEELAEVQGKLETARTREARYSREVASLNLLVSELEGRRTQARDVYFEPVQKELQPLLSILHDDAALEFDSSRLLPNGLERGGQHEELDVLSGGTQEQIAILTRLAFARLFARQGYPMPIILDDALVYSDDDRIVKMFTALHRVATDLQVIVFSCRQMAFAQLGGEQPELVIEQPA
ncbi:AAA family ATPase [Neptunicoccus cionae]|uniref:AAA family ATPase n=1 Tax=Neptunicoccus cionae TaxID=2035344 RepID=UPI000C78B192|nr:AAA family ATPase [Amylibacter cionae]PLS22384.1 hypothetical protein C0U40_08150 [Amylibacter cionae]